MGDQAKFLTVIQYNIFNYSFYLLCASEIIIYFTTSFHIGHSKRTGTDKGTFWLVMAAWSCSVFAGSYFRSQDVPAAVRNLLLSDWIYWIGIIFLIGGIILRCIAVFTLKHAFTLSVQTTSDQKLIQTGLYKIVRNPAYTGSIMSLLGISLAYRNIVGIISVIIICMVCYSIRIYVEEKALKDQFKNEFTLYCKKTKYRLIPGIY